MMIFERVHGFLAARRRALRIVALIALAVLAVVVGVGHLVSPQRHLDRTADALSDARGFSVTGLSEPVFEGPLTHQAQPVSFEADYAAPDKFSYRIMLTGFDAEGEPTGEQLELPAVSVGDEHFLGQYDADGELFFMQREQLPTPALDLPSARGLDNFLRTASDAVYLDEHDTLDGVDVGVISAVGNTAHWPGLIAHGLGSQTAKDASFVIWIDHQTDLPVRLEVLAVQEPAPIPGQTLNYQVTIEFIDFGPAEQMKAEPLRDVLPISAPDERKTPSGSWSGHEASFG